MTVCGLKDTFNLIYCAVAFHDFHYGTNVAKLS